MLITRRAGARAGGASPPFVIVVAPKIIGECILHRDLPSVHLIRRDKQSFAGIDGDEVYKP
jgi:hypothetical protein